MTPRETAKKIIKENLEDGIEDWSGMIRPIESALIQAKNEGLKEAADLIREPCYCSREVPCGCCKSCERTRSAFKILSLIKTVKTEEL